ncbi:hypothetical protein FZ025_17185 [Xanthomonas hyacinthi]|nr:YIP1 family protein [Xanthomonas hyacinthi]QGY78286.1 hypothetical protein FZ025_17185 [Xanthomonas hyacinthi]
MNVFTDSAKFFQRLDKKPSFLYFLLATITMASMVWIVYFKNVDFGWMIGNTLSSVNGLSDKQIELAQFTINPTVMSWSKAFGSGIQFLLWYLVMATYFWIVARLSGKSRRFLDWLGFQTWVGAPLFISLVAQLIETLIMPPRSMPSSIQLTHLDPLIMHLPTNSAWKGLASHFDLLNIGCIWLGAVAWRIWVGGGWGKCVLIAAAPYVLLYGGWAAFILAFR